MHKNKTKTRSPFGWEKEKTITLIVLMIIPVLNWIVFWFAVNVQSLALTFQEQRTGLMSFVNFMLLWDGITMVGGEIGIALINTALFFSTHILVLLPLSLIISFALYKRVYGYKIYRIMFYLPAVIPTLVMVTAFQEFILPSGPLSKILELFKISLPAEGLLATPGKATWTVLFYTIWTGFTTDVLLFSGGMSRIPLEIIEAAKIDGCSPAREIVNIFLPLIWPTVSTQIVLVFTGMFSAGGPILLLTNGAAETSTIAFWIFTQVYGSGQIGGTGNYNLVSCAGLCFTVIAVPLILFIRWLMGKVESVEY